MRLTPVLLSVVLLASITAPTSARAGEERPAFIPEIASLAGTWKHVYRYKDKKDVTLYLVIKEDDGKLRLRFQLPVRDKKTESDWDGQITLDMQVNMKQIQEVEYRPAADPPRIETSEVRRYTGSWKDKRFFTEGVYELTPEGKLQHRCISRTSNEQKEPLPCFAPFVYEFVSKKTDWPD